MRLFIGTFLVVAGLLYGLSLAGEPEVIKFIPNGGGPKWSPDGSKIIYCKPSYEGGTLWIMNPDGTGKTQIEGW